MGWVKGPAGSWDGGRVWEDREGRRTYIIRRQVGGRRFEVSTRCSRLRPALAQLERFEADPDGYNPASPGGEPLRLNLETAKAFLAWSAAPDGKGNSRPWVLQQRAYLAWWAEQLRGVDLRRVTLRDHVIPALDGQKGRKHRIEVLKAFFSWLRKERHVLTRQEDPTLDLAVPVRRPGQWRRQKDIPRAHFLRVLAKLEAPDHRDALVVLEETGWHVSELVRFARAGAVEALPRGREDGAVAVIACPQRKSGEPQRTAVGQKARAAAERLRAKGSFSVGRFYEAIRAACLKLKIDPFTAGRFRHTLATRALEAGVDPATIATYLGHRSASTTRRWYATHALAPRPKR